jgi:Flp pilus assembly protein TadG
MLDDCSGIAATEFAVIVPIMLVMFFGTVEISSGVSVDRKIKLVARALAFPIFPDARWVHRPLDQARGHS